MSKEKSKGGAFVRSLLPLLQTLDPTVTELVQAGKNDKGDAGGYYLAFGVEGKCYANYGGQLSTWLTEATREEIHAGKPVVVVFKRKGTTDPRKQYALMELGGLVDLVGSLTSGEQSVAEQATPARDHERPGL